MVKVWIDQTGLPCLDQNSSGHSSRHPDCQQFTATLTPMEPVEKETAWVCDVKEKNHKGEQLYCVHGKCDYENKALYNCRPVEEVTYHPGDGMNYVPPVEPTKAIERLDLGLIEFEACKDQDNNYYRFKAIEDAINKLRGVE